MCLSQINVVFNNVHIISKICYRIDKISLSESFEVFFFKDVLLKNLMKI